MGSPDPSQPIIRSTLSALDLKKNAASRYTSVLKTGRSSLGCSIESRILLSGDALSDERPNERDTCYNRYHQNPPLSPVLRTATAENTRTRS